VINPLGLRLCYAHQILRSSSRVDAAAPNEPSPIGHQFPAERGVSSPYGSPAEQPLCAECRAQAPEKIEVTGSTPVPTTVRGQFRGGFRSAPCVDAEFRAHYVPIESPKASFPRPPLTENGLRCVSKSGPPVTTKWSSQPGSDEDVRATSDHQVGHGTAGGRARTRSEAKSRSGPLTHRTSVSETME